MSCNIQGIREKTPPEFISMVSFYDAITTNVAIFKRKKIFDDTNVITFPI